MKEKRTSYTHTLKTPQTALQLLLAHMLIHDTNQNITIPTGRVIPTKQPEALQTQKEALMNPHFEKFSKRG